MTEEQKKIKLADLDRQRKSLGTLIGEWIGRNKTPRDIQFKVRQYEDLTNKMQKLGSNVYIRAPQLHSSFWDSHTVDDFKKLKNKPSQNRISQPSKPDIKQIIKEVYIEPKKSYYILNICWSESSEDPIFDKFEKTILPYLKYINIKCKKDMSDFDDHIEYIIKCEYKGYEEDFNLFKTTIEYLIQINNLDIEIYSKHKK